MKLRFIIFCCLLFGNPVLSVAASEENSAEKTTVNWVCENHLKKVRGLFAKLNLDYEGLEKVKKQVGLKDWPAACNELLAYYRNKALQDTTIKPLPEPGNKTVPAAEKILNDVFHFRQAEGKVPRLDSGWLDWNYMGPSGGREWGFALNRCEHFSVLLDAYFETGNPAYARCIDEHIRDWVTSPDNSYPGAKNDTSQWRGLEVSLRACNWITAFNDLYFAKEFSPAARILMISTVPNHAHYLQNYHRGAGTKSNWTVTELYGLGVVATSWPEFKEAPKWLNYALNLMPGELATQVYPGGAQKELASSYGAIVKSKFERFAKMATKAGFKLPRSFARMLEKMNNYFAYTLRPSGYGLFGNDTDLKYNRDMVLKKAREYDRPDWTYIATNGREGTKPEDPKEPSIIFPWAGQLIMRSGFDVDAHWGFFDVGPWGTFHQHDDKLHLSISAYGRDLLVDSGRYTYKQTDSFRSYFIGSFSHNVIIVNGSGQSSREKEAKEPLSKASYAIRSDYDYARGDTSGKAKHTRAVLYVRGKYWVVLDNITVDKPADVQVLWHYHPSCTTVVEGNTVTSTDPDKGNLRIVPVSSLPWDVEIVKGTEAPKIQGWYSSVSGHKEPNPTAIYSAKVDKTVNVIWLLIPAKGPVPNGKAEIITQNPIGTKLIVEVEGQEPVKVTIPLTRGRPRVTPIVAKDKQKAI